MVTPSQGYIIMKTRPTKTDTHKSSFMTAYNIEEAHERELVIKMSERGICAKEIKRLSFLPASKVDRILAYCT